MTIFPVFLQFNDVICSCSEDGYLALINPFAETTEPEENYLLSKNYSNPKKRSHQDSEKFEKKINKSVLARYKDGLFYHGNVKKMESEDSKSTKKKSLGKFQIEFKDFNSNSQEKIQKLNPRAGMLMPSTLLNCSKKCALEHYPLIMKYQEDFMFSKFGEQISAQNFKNDDEEIEFAKKNSIIYYEETIAKNISPISNENEKKKRKISK